MHSYFKSIDPSPTGICILSYVTRVVLSGTRDTKDYVPIAAKPETLHNSSLSLVVTSFLVPKNSTKAFHPILILPS